MSCVPCASFFAPEGVAVVRPCLRQFSDLPSWMDSAEAEALLRDRRVLMYCTGGVRCERASAYLRSKGQGFQDVMQLQGGIQRYACCISSSSAATAAAA